MNQLRKITTIATWIFPFMLLIVALGFWPSYFSQLARNRVSIHIHSAMMFVWMAALVAQPILIRKGRFTWHRRIGVGSYVVAPLVVVSGMHVTYEVLKRAGGDPSEFEMQVFTMSVVSILAFGFLYVLAIAYVRKPHLHARFMIGTGLILVGPGMLRVFLHWIPWVSGLSASEYAALIVMELATVGLIINDRRIARASAPFVIVLFLLLLLHLMFWKAPSWNWWQGVAAWIGQGALT